MDDLKGTAKGATEIIWTVVGCQGGTDCGG